MQLISMVSAVALLSTSALAAPEIEKKSPSHWWQIRQNAHSRHHHHQQSTSDPATSIAVSSSTVDESAMTTDGAAYTTIYYTVASGDTTDYGAAYTTIYSTEGGSPAPTGSHHRHNHTRQHIFLTSSLACPATVSTSYVTITSSVTRTTYVSSSQSWNSSTYSNSSSTAFTSSAPASNSLTAYNSSSSASTPSQGFPSSSANLTSATANSFTTLHSRHHTRHRITHSSSSAILASSVTTSVSISASPVSVANGTTNLHPSSTVTATTTITGSSQPTGTPNPAAYHCGVHGLPIGDYFIAEFVENKAGEDVTLLGCYEFCTSVYGVDKGCVSYDFYPEPGTGAARCDLYGGSVAASLNSISNVPNVWYDLGCGNPEL